MYGIDKLRAADRVRMVGRRRPIRSLVGVVRRLHAGLGFENKGEVGPTFYSNRDLLDMFEESLHELAHHVCLIGDVDLGRRTRSIRDEITDLTPAASDGNELDALALEFTTAWWLGHPLNIHRYVQSASNGNLNYIQGNTAHRIVADLLVDASIMRMGFELAMKIQSERS
jgi:hypothetical protein